MAGNGSGCVAARNPAASGAFGPDAPVSDAAGIVSSSGLLRAVARLLLSTAASCLLLGRLEAAERPSLGGEASASWAEPQDRAFFNYTDYEQNALRQARVRFDVAWPLGRRLELLASARGLTGDGASLFAAYARLRPWPDRRVDLQAGRIPPVFGAFGRRSYGADNPLIGLPLAYQYLTTLRSDALPARADDLLRNRGRGWRVAHPLGSPSAAGGLPIMAGDRWDAGIELRVAAETLGAAAALTSGTLSNPLVRDDNDGKQLAARLEARPVVGLVVGLSGSRGAYLRRSLAEVPGVGPAAASARQRALGLDVEWSGGAWLVRSEAVLADWRVPSSDASLADPLAARTAWVEGRFKVHPRLYVAGRADHLDFSRVSGTLFDGRRVAWDAPVTRLEIGAGCKLSRRALAKLAYQQNWRHAAPRRGFGTLAGQVLWWY